MRASMTSKPAARGGGRVSVAPMQRRVAKASRPKLDAPGRRFMAKGWPDPYVETYAKATGVPKCAEGVKGV